MVSNTAHEVRVINYLPWLVAIVLLVIIIIIFSVCLKLRIDDKTTHKTLVLEKQTELEVTQKCNVQLTKDF